MDKLPPNLCLIPWLHLSSSNQGSLRLCCNSSDSRNHSPKKPNGYYYKVNSLEDINNFWSSDFMNSIRQQFLDNKQPDVCKNCFSKEKYFSKSPRTIFNEKYNHLMSDIELTSTPPLRPVNIDIRLGNFCNLKCVMCDVYASYKWIEDYEKLTGINMEDQLKSANWFKLREGTTPIKHVLSSVTDIYFAGGEPLIIREQYDLIDYIVEQNYSNDINLMYNTNLSFLPLNMREKWDRFKTVDFLISVDGYESVNDFIRYPAKWHRFNNNLTKLLELYPTIAVSFNVTVQIYNIFSLNSLVEYLNKVSPNAAITFNLLTDPKHLDIRILPSKYKDKAISNLKLILSSTTNIKVKNDITNLINYICSEESEENFQLFLDYTEKIKIIRNITSPVDWMLNND